MRLSHVLDAQGERQNIRMAPAKAGQRDTPAIADSCKDRLIGLLGERVKPDEILRGLKRVKSYGQ